MKRLVIPVLALLGLVAVSAPASAYCVLNETKIPLSVVLKTSSQLGNYHEVVKPGHKICCDWFDRRCNPTGTREAMVSLSIRNLERKGLTVDQDNSITKFGDNKLIVDEAQSADRFDQYGRPHVMGRYDRYGRDTRYDRYGRFDASRPMEYRRQQIEALREAWNASDPDVPMAKGPQARFCARGKQPVVLATGAGTVTVTEDSLKSGGLDCTSRDHFLRPVAPPSQASEFGVPITEMPAMSTKPAKRGTQTPYRN